MPSGPPNVVVIVLDCVRASDFPGSGPNPVAMPFCESLAKESVIFPKAVSPSPWTLPSHASLFSGLQPWETGCHWKGNLQLPASTPRLASALRSRGYRTYAMSANPLLSPTFNVFEGFDRAGWAEWWEPYLRFGKGGLPAHQVPEESARASSWLSRVRVGPIDAMVKRSVGLFYKHPVVLDAGSRFIQGLNDEAERPDISIARWIEPTVAQWVNDTPISTPIHLFVNLLEAHEPYFSIRGLAHGPSALWAYLRARQDNIGFLAGEWSPSAGELDLLHDLYRVTLGALDRRVQAIVQVLKDSDRWENTLFILTSDHGQAFGEHGFLFHMISIDDPVLRIPLWMRLPGGESGGSRGRGWATLIDVTPTVSRLTGMAEIHSPHAHSLVDLVDAERPEPVVSISDGIPWSHFRRRFPEDRARTLDRPKVAAYEGDWKWIVDDDAGPPALFDVRKDPMESSNLGSQYAGRAGTLDRAAQTVAHVIKGSVPAQLAPDVDERLRAWGYV